MRQWTLLVLVLGLALAGCKKSEGETKTAEAPKGPDTAAIQKNFTEKALPAVNAAVPADAPKTEFEAKLVEKDGIVAAIPKGWQESDVIPGNYEPPKDATGFGFMTRYTVGTNCDGMCEPKDWKAVAEKVNFAPLQGDNFEVKKTEELKEPAGKLQISTTKDGKKTYIHVARWKDGARQYFTCSAALEDDAMKLAPAFEKACIEAVPVFLQ